MANKIIKGIDLMLFDVSGNSFSYATNHVLTISTETADVSSKDHGIWAASEVTKYSWEITSENLFTETDYSDMFDKMMAGTPIVVRFGIKSQTDSTKNVVDGDYENWTSAEDGYYTGKVLITSLSANASNGETATMSVTLTGVGKISKATKA